MKAFSSEFFTVAVTVTFLVIPIAMVFLKNKYFLWFYNVGKQRLKNFLDWINWQKFNLKSRKIVLPSVNFPTLTRIPFTVVQLSLRTCKYRKCQIDRVKIIC